MYCHSNELLDENIFENIFYNFVANLITFLLVLFVFELVKYSSENEALKIRFFIHYKVWTMSKIVCF